MTTNCTVCHDEWDNKLNNMSLWLWLQTEQFVTIIEATKWTVCHNDWDDKVNSMSCNDWDDKVNGMYDDFDDKVNDMS